VSQKVTPDRKGPVRRALVRPRSIFLLPFLLGVGLVDCASRDQTAVTEDGGGGGTSGGASGGSGAASGGNRGNGGSASSDGGNGATSGGSGATSGGSGAASGGSGAASGGGNSGNGASASGDGGSGGGTADDGGDQGAQGVQCGASICYAPNACCRNTPSSTPSCVVACSGTEQELCANSADCQCDNAALCVNGVCTDPDGGTLTCLGSIAGESDAGGLPPDGGYLEPPSDGEIPNGFPTPTAANAATCKTVAVSDSLTASAPPACAGAPAGNACIECLFGGTAYNANDVPPPTAAATAEAGNYLVTVQLGGSATSQTTVSVESSRGVLGTVVTAAGRSVEYAFIVNVRGMEGQPDHAGGPGGYPGLDLFFTGPTASPPRITGIGYTLATAMAPKPIQVFVASDSTACDQSGGAYGGWGQMLPEYFGPAVSVANYANSGASSSSFYGSQALWGSIKAHWTTGDYVLIQFGHNDKGIADATVQANLVKYVVDAKAAGVNAIVISPPARVQFVGNVEGDQSSLHAVSAQGAATAEGVAFVDLTSLSTAWYNSLGSQAAALKYHANGTDATHTNLQGAEMLAGLVTKNMKTQNLSIAQYLR
jgi:lysophospholipase L1-like esterase